MDAIRYQGKASALYIYIPLLYTRNDRLTILLVIYKFGQNGRKDRKDAAERSLFQRPHRSAKSARPRFAFCLSGLS